MKCPIHGQEMLIRNGGGGDFHIDIEFECPHPECHHWYVVVNQKMLIEGWRKRPTPSRELDERVYHKPLQEIHPPEGYKMTPEKRKEYLESPRRLAHYVRDDRQGDLFLDNVKEKEH
ncbi:MAG TPA: hypothetical protein PKX17_04420, partial [Candidatus Methanomethylicus sp.]|nr:hypothetical protein [Candidatus Methanomethylicus sp.]